MSVLARVEAVRRQMMACWPEDCCEKTTITQGTATGAKETVPACTNDCKWQEMAKVLALAEIDLSLEARRPCSICHGTPCCLEGAPKGSYVSGAHCR